MHISSLPGKFGIGTLGKEAYKFVDFLSRTGLSYWQILPLGPTGYGDSPYQSFSAFAGNPYFIDFDILNEEGILEKLDYESFSGCTNLRTVYSLATTPPAATYDTFEKCPEDRILYVPKASLKDYKNADYWKDFAQILPIETAGINDVIDTDLVYSSKEKGKVSITGLHIGEIIQCYNASGLLIQTCKAASNEIAITTEEPIIIIKARKQTNKIFVKQ